MRSIGHDERAHDIPSIAPDWAGAVEAVARELAAVRGQLAAIERALGRIVPPVAQEPSRHRPRREGHDAGSLRLVPPPPAGRQAHPGCPHGLSPREREVLRLIAAGLSTRAMAAALCRSERTVERHTENLYRKIGAHNKADATRFAMRHRLA